MAQHYTPVRAVAQRVDRHEHLSHDLPCQHCHHAAHPYLPCDVCDCTRPLFGAEPNLQ